MVRGLVSQAGGRTGDWTRREGRKVWLVAHALLAGAAARVFAGKPLGGPNDWIDRQDAPSWCDVETVETREGE